MQKQKFSTLGLAIDLVYTEYKTKNPILLSEKIYLDLGMDYSIHEIIDYLEMNDNDFPRESKKVEYYSIYNN